MARPKSTNPRSLTTTMRLTAPESEYLTTVYGSPGKGLRHLLNREMKGGTMRDREKTREPSVPLAPAAPEYVPDVRGGGTLHPNDLARMQSGDIEVAAGTTIIADPRKSGKTKRSEDTIKRLQGIVAAGGAKPETIAGELPEAPKSPSPSGAKRHLHKPEGDPIRTFAEKGVQWKVYLCSCGEELKR